MKFNEHEQADTYSRLICLTLSSLVPQPNKADGAATPPIINLEDGFKMAFKKMASQDAPTHISPLLGGTRAFPSVFD